jgi:hypothetical protein
LILVCMVVAVLEESISGKIPYVDICDDQHYAER